MIELALSDLAVMTGGELSGISAAEAASRVVTGPVVVDSRLVGSGGLFAAVAGERVDGHDFAAAAMRAGAAGVLATRPVDGPAVIVDDTVAALGRLARAVLDRLHADGSGLRVIGVTGSQGKTGTKDLLAQLLATQGPTIAPPGSFNNEIGLPLTALQVDPTTRYLVLEMGARGRGHIRYLCEVAPPQIGVVLNVGLAHLGEFGSREEIALAKREIVEALPPDGVAVLNADDPFVAAMAEHTNARLVTFGIGSGAGTGADVCAEQIVLDEHGRPAFRLVTPRGVAEARLRLHGEHHVVNALAAAAVALELGLTPDEIAEALGRAEALSRWRMEVTERADGVTVVNDAYNANPDSMRAALKALVAMARGRRTWAVLGEMRELGQAAREEHDAVGRLAVRLDISRLVVVGEGAKPTHLGASLEGSWGEESAFVPDTGAALELLRNELRPGDVVLIKASRAAGLEQVADALLADVAAGPPARHTQEETA
jgi:UDP-N-acetylmuramoyl-tripeptide--D-alanyl-D-alanine ligase